MARHFSLAEFSLCTPNLASLSLSNPTSGTIEPRTWHNFLYWSGASAAHCSNTTSADATPQSRTAVAACRTYPPSLMRCSHGDPFARAFRIIFIQLLCRYPLEFLHELVRYVIRLNNPTWACKKQTNFIYDNLVFDLTCEFYIIGKNGYNRPGGWTFRNFHSTCTVIQRW